MQEVNKYFEICLSKQIQHSLFVSIAARLVHLAHLAYLAQSFF